jgi:phosphohistidine phosphatase
MTPAPTIYLVRHAIAEERGEDWPDDDERPLAHAGTAKMRRAVSGLRELDMKVDVVLTSPLVRAVETAELLVAGLKPVPALQVLPLLAPGGSPAKISEALGSVDAPRGLAVVGHEPGIGDLAAWLLGARMAPEFRKGAVCRIDLDGAPAARAGRLIWHATPKMLRSLGK